VTAVMRALDGLRKALGTPPVHHGSAADTAGEAAGSAGCECCAETVSTMARAMRVLCTVSYEALKWVAAEATPEAAATAFSRAGATAAAAAVTATRLWTTRATEQTHELTVVVQCAAWPLLSCAELRWLSGSVYNLAVELQRAGGEAGRCQRLFRAAWQLGAAATTAAVRDAGQVDEEAAATAAVAGCSWADAAGRTDVAAAAAALVTVVGTLAAVDALAAAEGALQRYCKLRCRHPPATEEPSCLAAALRVAAPGLNDAVLTEVSRCAPAALRWSALTRFPFIPYSAGHGERC
jgi:hypothetical protein